jgi:hypothetical protein
MDPKTVGAVYDRPRCLGFDTVGGHRHPLQLDHPEFHDLRSAVAAAAASFTIGTSRYTSAIAEVIGDKIGGI